MTRQPLPTSAIFAEFGFIVFYLLYLHDGDPWITIPGGILLLATLALTVRTAMRTVRQDTDAGPSTDDRTSS